MNNFLRNLLIKLLGEIISKKIFALRRSGVFWTIYSKLVKFLYYINLEIIKLKTKNKIPNINEFYVTKINLDKDFIDNINKDLDKKKYIFLDKTFSLKHLTWKFPMSYLKDVKYSWGFDRRYYANYIDKNLQKTIKSYYGEINYRIELMEMFITPKGSKNVNANFHTDGDYPGSLKIMIYLSDVDEESGPLAFISKKNNKITKILGKKGTVIFFNNTEVKHAGMPSISKERAAMTFQLYPTLRKNIAYLKTKPINAFCNVNPFSKIS
tara:strand:- start:240 stop:1040 length:801 start_codon:yes stop_codon:yes gene_type:complete